MSSTVDPLAAIPLTVLLPRPLAVVNVVQVVPPSVDPDTPEPVATQIVDPEAHTPSVKLDAKPLVVV